DVDRLGVLGDEAPLHPGEEAGAAAAAQVRLLDLVDDLGGLHAQRLLDRGVAAALLEDRDLLVVLVAQVLRQQLGVHGGRHQDTCSERGFLASSSSARSTFSGVRSRKYSVPQIIIGALAQAARHSSSTRVKRPSAVVSPGRTPSLRSMWPR